MPVAAKQRKASLGLGRELVDTVPRHRLLTFASAVSFRALVAFVPLTLLALGILGAIGRADLWTKSIAPAIRPRVSGPVFHGIDYSVKRIFASDKGSLITLASALVLWHMTAAVATVMETLNRIHEVEDKRRWRKLLVALALAAATSLCLVGAFLIVLVAPKAGSGSGAVHFLLGVGRWLIAAALLMLAIALLVRYAPAEHPRPRWASAGSIAIVAAWIVLSLVFRVWMTSLSNFKNGIGLLTGFLVLGAYLYLSVFVFILGVQLDELLRNRQERG